MTNRREFLTGLAVGSLAAMAAAPARVGTAARVVVVGGGIAGATAAKYLRLWSGRSIAVTLVEKEVRHTSSLMSNLVLTGQRSLSSLYVPYDHLMSRYGVRMVRGEVSAIALMSGGTWSVKVSSAAAPLVCDRVVLAPGVGFDAVPDMHDPARPADVLHAWQAGAGTELLRQRIAVMHAGGVFLLAIPPAPFRSPTGPYERACLVADLFARNKPGSKVIVLDANPGIVAHASLFDRAFRGRYAGIVDYRPDTAVIAVDAARSRVRTARGETIEADVLNVVPPQRAGAIVQALGLADDAGVRFAAVDARTFESAQAPGIHVIGDACASALPKAGHFGNQAAKICAVAIVNAINGEPAEPSPSASSACYTPISNALASRLAAAYRYDRLGGDMTPCAAAADMEDSEPSPQSFSQMTAWSRALINDSFA